MRTIILLSTFAALFINGLVSLLVLLKSKNRKAGRTFFFLMWIFNGWIITNLIAQITQNQSFAIINERLTYVFGSLIVPCFILFVYYFPFETKFSIKKYFLLATPAVVIFGLAFSNFFVRTVQIEPGHVNAYYLGDYHWAFGVFILVYVGIYHVIFFQKFRQLSSTDKNRMRYVLYSFLVAAIIGYTLDIIIPIVMGSTGSKTGTFGADGTVIISLGVTYAILKYRLLDIQIAIQRGIARILTFCIIFGFFAYLLLFIERNVEATSERNVSLLIVVVVLVLTVEPLRRWIYRFVDGLFDNQERKRRDALQRIQLVASSTLQFTSLVERLTSELRTVFGVDVHFLLRDEQHGKLAGATELSLKDPIAGQIVDGKVIITDELPYRIDNGEAMLAPLHTWLQNNKVSAVLPIGNREDFVGAFLFHDGQGSAPFTTDRVEFLKRFRNQVQFAFASAYAYKLAVERISQ